MVKDRSVRVISLTSQLLEWPEAREYVTWSAPYEKWLERYGVVSSGEDLKKDVEKGKMSLEGLNRKERKKVMMEDVRTGLPFKEFKKKYGEAAVSEVTYYKWKRQLNKA